MKTVVSGLRENLVNCIMAHGRVEGTHEGRKYSPEGVNVKAPGNAADSKIHGKRSVQGGIKKDMPPWYEDNGQGIGEEDVAVNDQTKRKKYRVSEMDADWDNTAFDVAPAHETGRGPQQDLGSNVAAETTQSDGMYTFQDHGKTDEPDLMQQQPVFDCTPERSGGPSTRIPLWQSEGDNCVKNVEEEVKTTSARGERIKKGLSNPSFGNKKREL